MKTIILLIALSSIAFGQTKFEPFSKSNIIHVGKRGYIERDKFLHSTAGAWVGSSVYMYVHYKTDRPILSAALSVLSAFIVSEAKELYDRNKGGKFSNDDLAATTFGGWTGAFTKIIQIGIQTQNKIDTEELKAKYENLNSK